MKIAVLMGGKSSEREISLKTGRAVSKGLRELGYEVVELDLTEDIACKLLEIKPDKVFIALHGTYGEDGRVQGMLDLLGIDYVGSGVKSSALAMDKDLTKRILSCEGIPTPEWVSFRIKDEIPNWEKFPAIVKPADQGSSVGLFLVKDREEMISRVKELFQLTEKIVVESFVEGRDMTVGLIKGKPLPVIEIIPKKGIYDYESKYTAGKSEYVFPPESDLTKELQDIALRTANILEIEDMGRVDFRVDEKGNPYVLEVNTIPGMTELSLLPMACKKAGISFNEMLSIILS